MAKNKCTGGVGTKGDLGMGSGSTATLGLSYIPGRDTLLVHEETNPGLISCACTAATRSTRVRRWRQSGQSRQPLCSWYRCRGQSAVIPWAPSLIETGLLNQHATRKHKKIMGIRAAEQPSEDRNFSAIDANRILVPRAKSWVGRGPYQVHINVK